MDEQTDTPEKKVNTPEEKEEIKQLSSKDVSDLITQLNELIKGYRKKESPLSDKQKELVLRRVLSFWVCNGSFNNARVSIHISDDLGYGWEQTK
jgi:hypothetical protein